MSPRSILSDKTYTIEDRIDFSLSISETILTGDIATISNRIGPSGQSEGKLYTKATPGHLKMKQRKYDRKNKERIKRKRDQVKKSVQGKKGERDKKYREQTGRTAIKGKRQRKYNI